MIHLKGKCSLLINLILKRKRKCKRRKFYWLSRVAPLEDKKFNACIDSYVYVLIFTTNLNPLFFHFKGNRNKKKEQEQNIGRGKIIRIEKKKRSLLRRINKYISLFEKNK